MYGCLEMVDRETVEDVGLGLALTRMAGTAAPVSLFDPNTVGGACPNNRGCQSH